MSTDGAFGLRLVGASARTTRSRLEAWLRSGEFTATSMQATLERRTKYYGRIGLTQTHSNECVGDGLCGYRMLRLAYLRQTTGIDHPIDLQLANENDRHEMLLRLERLYTLRLEVSESTGVPITARISKALAWVEQYHVHHKTFMPENLGGWMGTFAFDCLAQSLALDAILIAQTGTNALQGNIVGDSRHEGQREKA